MFSNRSTSARKKFWGFIALKTLLYPFGLSGAGLHRPTHGVSQTALRCAGRRRKRHVQKSGMQARLELSNFETVPAGFRPG